MHRFHRVTLQEQTQYPGASILLLTKRGFSIAICTRSFQELPANTARTSNPCTFAKFILRTVQVLRTLTDYPRADADANVGTLATTCVAGVAAVPCHHTKD